MSGWNGSGQRGNSAPIQPKAKAKKPSPIRGLVAGLVVVAVICVAYFAFFSGSEKPQEEKSGKERGRIKEVKPAAAPTNAVQTAKVKPEKPAKPKKIPYWEQASTNGFTEMMQLKWLQRRRPRREPVVIDRPKPKYEIFDYESENTIASVITAEPGVTSFFGELSYKGMKEDFLKSCESPIIVSETDDEYTKALKRQMIQTKIEIKERLDAGEDFGKIISDAREDYNRLAEANRQLQHELREYMKSHPSDEDLGDFVEAANKLLASKGSAPLRVGLLVKNRLKRLNKKKENMK